MNKITVFGILLCLAVVATGCGSADPGSTATGDPGAAATTPPAAAPPGRGEATAMVAGQEVSIDYGRPQLKGRAMLGQLPEGQSWRFGQNQATVIKTGTDLQFGNTLVAAGSYSLFLKKGSADSWSLIFNQQTGQWGTEHDAAQDVYEVELTPTQSDESVEVFTITLEGGGAGGVLTASWDTLVLSASFQTVG